MNTARPLLAALHAATSFPIEEETIQSCVDTNLPVDELFARARLNGLTSIDRSHRSGHLARVTGEIAESVAEIILEECDYSLFWQITAPGMHGVDLLFITPDNAVLALEVIGNTSTRHDPASHSVASAPDEPRLAQ